MKNNYKQYKTEEPNKMENNYKQYLDQLNTTGKVAFAILCAKQVYKDRAWNAWADKWLSGEDRSEKSAANVIAARAFYADIYGARVATVDYAKPAKAATYAAYATAAAYTASYAKGAKAAAAYAAYAATAAYADNININFESIFNKAKQIENNSKKQQTQSFDSSNIYKKISEALILVYK